MGSNPEDGESKRSQGALTTLLLTLRRSVTPAWAPSWTVSFFRIWIAFLTPSTPKQLANMNGRPIPIILTPRASSFRTSVPYRIPESAMTSTVVNTCGALRWISCALLDGQQRVLDGGYALRDDGQ
ncbi:hypothetical protein N8I77_007515 [Diaporthe amygdali]|uniref:Uncharacterized protein n=1 Tax=Phomopsis amygdali TaxID=1214568 RepID=A0AAD9SBU4_PHOAM|nr:hypothetical protein N8I77_007515 [Diaporthe amygdali]